MLTFAAQKLAQRAFCSARPQGRDPRSLRAAEPLRNASCPCTLREEDRQLYGVFKSAALQELWRQDPVQWEGDHHQMFGDQSNPPRGWPPTTISPSAQTCSAA